MFNFAGPVPLSLYVHLPWCVSKCPYCDFNSYEMSGALPEQAYVDALIRDLEAEWEGVAGREIGSVFFGGGTPSLFAAAAVERVLAAVAARARLASEAEITLEANPGTFDTGRFAAYRRAGVNRLSIGVQSLDSGRLQAIGRIHDGAQARAALEGARAAGFDNINVDLMYGLPGQGGDQALADVEGVLQYRPEHVSHYQLTLEPQTRFYHQPPPALPDDEALWAVQLQCQALLAARGYEHYEVSAYARPGRRCRHNLNYWRFGDYLGIGAGAHSKLTDITRRRVERSWKVKQPRLYMQEAGTPRGVAGREALSPQDAAFEFMLNALRLVEGFDEGLFQGRTGLELGAVAGALDAARDKGLLDRDGPRVRATPAGYRYLNDLLQLFLPEPA